MPSALARTVTLTPHPETPSRAVQGVIARVSQMPDGMLAVTYIIEGDLERVRVPAPCPPRAADKLWQHTCCELFIARGGQPGYYEFNFAPSGEWAAYKFDHYRERTPPADGVNAADLDPEIMVRALAEKLELNVLIHLERLSPAPAVATLSLALSAVIEDRDGSFSYWALKHPPGKPDFHHPDAFALELDEVRD